MNVRFRQLIAYAGLFSGIILLDTKSAVSQTNPVLTLSANQVNFFNLPGGGTATQTLTLNTSSSGAVTINTSNLPSWIQVTPNGSVNLTSGTPTTLTVTATPPSGTAPGSYDTSFTVGNQGSNATPQTIVVTSYVTGTSILSASPSSLTFMAQPGASEATPTTASVKISSSGQTLDYTATASTSNGQNWLIPFTLSGTTGSSSFSGSALEIGVNPAGLAAGTYLGQVLVQSTSSSDSVTIAVALTVGTNTSLTITPSTVQPFSYQANTPTTASMTQTLTLTSNSGSPNFSVTENPQVTWLGASIAPPTTTTAGGSASTLTLMVLPVQTPGVYTTSLVITNGSAQTTIPISYTVGVGQVPQVSPSQLTFTSSTSQIPASQTVQVSLPNTGSAVGVSVTSSAPWLSATASSQMTPATLTVTANPAGLAAGKYTGTLTVRPTNGDQYAIPITATLTVTGAPALLTSGPPVLLFTNQIGQAAPPAQIVQLTSNGQTLNYTSATTSTTSSNCPANFLQAASPSTSPSTPSGLAVSINSTGLTAGICSGTVTVNYSNPGATGNLGSLQIPVIVETSATPLLSVSVPSGFGFENTNVCSVSNVSPTGSSSTSTSTSMSTSTSTNTGSGSTTTTTNNTCSLIMRQISITSTDGQTPLSFTASATNNGSIPWLFVAPNSGQTPGVLTVLIDPAGLAAGTDNGSITISSGQTNPSGLPMPITIPVSLSVNSNITVTASQSSLTFNQTTGGSLPASQTLTLSSSATGATYSAVIPSTANCAWLQVSPMSGPATGTITVGVGSNTLTQNTTCSFTLVLTGASSKTIPITATLNVGSGSGTGSGNPTVTASASTLNFTETAGGSAPASQTFTLTSSATGATYSAVLPTSANCSWLQVSPMSGAATGTITVSVASNTLAQNTYSCPITLNLTGASTQSISVATNLTVNAAQGQGTSAVTVAPPSLTFTSTSATPQPTAQQIVISNTSTSGNSATFSIAATSSGWLAVTPTSGSAPANITVSVNPQMVGSGTSPFTGTIAITVNGSSTPINVPVTLNKQ